MWYVYILKCNDNTLYTGVTTDVQRRFKEHKEGKTGAKYTRGRFPLEIAYEETCPSRSEAQVREAQIKKLTRSEKLVLIKTSKRKN
jgi:putative endonuclease